MIPVERFLQDIMTAPYTKCDEGLTRRVKMASLALQLPAKELVLTVTLKPTMLNNVVDSRGTDIQKAGDDNTPRKWPTIEGGREKGTATVLLVKAEEKDKCEHYNMTIALFMQPDMLVHLFQLHKVTFG